MRICLVFKRFSENGGSERQMSLLSRELASAGHEVDVFCRSVQTQPAPGVRLHRMPSMPLGSFSELVVFSAWVRRAVQRVERRDGAFDVTHAFGRTRGQSVYRVGGGCHPTYLAHAHALDRPVWLRRWLRRTPFQRWKARLERQTLTGPQSPHVITNSAMVRDDLSFRYGVPDDRLHVVRNGVDLERFRPATTQERERARAAHGLSADARVVLFLGSGYARKGLEAALRAAAVLAPRRPSLRLLVGGRDKRTEQWRALARRLGVAEHVRWLGSVERPEELYWAADCYTLPTTYDPAANSTLEALACGVPVVTTTMNGASEILVEGEHGSVITPPVDPQELAAAWERWIDEAPTPERAARLRAHASEYPAHASAHAMIDVYQRVRSDRAERSAATR